MSNPSIKPSFALILLFRSSKFYLTKLVKVVQLLQTSIGRFRILAFMEGLSFIVILFITMPLKYQFDLPRPNLVVGMAHGVLFILYVFAVIKLRIAQKWKSSLTLKALIASVVPFGTFYMDRKVFRNL